MLPCRPHFDKAEPETEIDLLASSNSEKSFKKGSTRSTSVVGINKKKRVLIMNLIMIYFKRRRITRNSI